MSELVTVDREKLKDYATQALAPFPEVAGVYLFGSALGECRPDSDIDLAVMLPTALIQGEKDREVWEARLMEALRPFGGHPFDLTIFNPDNILFSFRILSEGEPLLIRDEELVGDLMEYVSRRYPEVNYRYQQALAEILGEVFHHEH